MARVLRDDVADALVPMLTQPDHVGATYELTGPGALTLTEVAAEVSRSSDRTVTFQNETLEEPGFRERATALHRGS